jgi:hypothetical protein
MKGKALLFGLNYSHIPAATLNGCINDVRQMSLQIQNLFDDQLQIEVFTDDVDKKNTSYDGMVQNLYNLAIQSYSDNLDFVWVHFSGHGSQKKDTSGDELDYLDEGICPSDYNIKGIIIDDILNNVVAKFNPKTKILFVADCCHSGSILDLKYSWDVDGRKCKTDNKNCKIRSNAILISGCMDNQTSADAYNLLNDRKHIGALTASFIKVLNKRPQQLYDVFSFVSSVRTELRRGGFNQYPCLSSTNDVSKEPSMILPIHNRAQQQSIEEQIFDIPVQQPSPPPPPKLMNKPFSAFRPIPNRPITQQMQQPPQIQQPQMPPPPQMQQQYYHSIPQRPSYYEAQNTFAPQLVYVTFVPTQVIRYYA